MTVLDMHYDFKVKYNRIDTSSRKSFLSQELDWLLNGAQTQYVLSRLQMQGLPEGQRNLDDIRTVIAESSVTPVNNEVAFPPDQIVLLKAEANVTKAGCGTKWVRIFTMPHDDYHQYDTFAKSSFEWEELNAEYRNGRYLLFPTDFTVNTVKFTYVRTPRPIFYALSPYRTPGGELRSGTQDCELPPHTHEAIVDLAVANAIISEDGSLPSRLAKLEIQ